MMEPEIGFCNKAYRLYYDDSEPQPCLDFTDILWLDKTRSVEVKWGLWCKTIIMQYETKYMKERLHTFFRPYFFRAKLPSTFSVHEGAITVLGTFHDCPRRHEDAHGRTREADTGCEGCARKSWTMT